MLARGAAVTVLYQGGEGGGKNPERNKDRFCGERSCCGNRPVIGRARAPRAYKSRCEWLKGLAQQLEPRVCSCSASLNSPFRLSRLWDHLLGDMRTGDLGDLLFLPCSALSLRRSSAALFASWL